MKRFNSLGLAAVAMLGCGGGGGGATIDAPAIDAAPDAPNPCAPLELYTGEYVDWDSSDANFLGIFGANIAVGSAGSNTAPNGRFRVCIQPTDTTATLTPAAGSGSADDYLPGVAAINHTVIDDQLDISMRSFTQARMTTMFQSIGSAFDSTKGQLFVHTNGAVPALTIDADHATTFAYGSAETWAAGDVGTYVFFPNVDVSTAVTLSANGSGSGSQQSGQLSGTGNLGTLPAGTMFYVEVAE